MFASFSKWEKWASADPARAVWRPKGPRYAQRAFEASPLEAAWGPAARPEWRRILFRRIFSATHIRIYENNFCSEMFPLALDDAEHAR